MTYKDTYYLRLSHRDNPDVWGVGECALFCGLGADDLPDYEERLAEMCRRISSDGLEGALPEGYSSITFGVETALADLRNGGRRTPWPGRWSEGRVGIPINGLVWMGSYEQMMHRLDEKIAAGFRCIKIKIGGIEFERELDMLRALRRRYPADLLEVRLDANGGFTPDEALSRLDTLAPLGIHSLEQPIRQGQWREMARICAESPIPIALDEELIGCRSMAEKAELLDAIRPSAIILKPSLCGGFAAAEEWARMARERNMIWWATSALESDIGLNAIAQWCDSMHTTIPQGLGTGRLYTNNIESPLYLHSDTIRYNPLGEWRLPKNLQWK